MKNKILFLSSLLFGLMMLNAGLNKFFNYMPMPENLPQTMKDLMKVFISIKWLLPLVGVVEIVGGLFFIFPKTRALGAIIIFPIMVGILLINIVQAPSGFPLALTLFLINCWVIVENKEKYLPIIK